MVRPYGGKLIDQVVSDIDIKRRAEAARYRLNLGTDDVIHLINLATGIYSPLAGFMCKKEYLSVLSTGKLPNGVEWHLPITLSIPESCQFSHGPEDLVALEGNSGELLGVLEPKDLFRISRADHTRLIYGTGDSSHPGVSLFLGKSNLCIGGTIYLSDAVVPKHQFFGIPKTIRSKLSRASAQSACAFSTRNICHLGHEHLHGIVLEITDLMGINVITGPETTGSFRSDVVLETYQYLIANFYPKEKVFLNSLQIPAILAGPKEAFHQAIMLQNLGFSHFIVGRDHAGVGDFYDKYESQNFLKKNQDLEIKVLAISEPRYCNVCKKITTERSCQHNDQIDQIDGRDIRHSLQQTTRTKESLRFVRDELTSLLDEIRCRGNQSENGVNLSKRQMRQLFYP